MKILIKDEQGLGAILMMDGFSQKEILCVKEAIRLRFKEAAITVFKKVLGKPLPETIVVDMVQNSNQELSGDKAIKMASFNSELSRNDYLIFTICEVTVKIAMKENDNVLFRGTVIHEMLHAADQPMLVKNRKLFETLRNEIYANADDFFSKGKNDSQVSLFNTLNKNDTQVALFNTLKMFEHYRAEGIAILGEYLLTKRCFDVVIDALEGFRRIFELTMVKSKNWALGVKDKGEIFDDNTVSAAYLIAPSILLLVLARMELVEKATTISAMEGLNSGDYELTEAETELIIRVSMSLSLSDFIQGVVSLGEKVAPAKPFLEFCALLQKEYEADNIVAFSDLLSLPQTKEMFQTAMKQIMGCVMDEEEIDSYYKIVIAHSNDETVYSQMKEKVERLYWIMKNDSDGEKTRIAKWALTYLFDDQDVIHDDVKGLGYVDDMAVMDYALKVLEKRS